MMLSSQRSILVLTLLLFFFFSGRLVLVSLFEAMMVKMMMTTTHNTQPLPGIETRPLHGSQQHCQLSYGGGHNSVKYVIFVFICYICYICYICISQFVQSFLKETEKALSAEHIYITRTL